MGQPRRIGIVGLGVISRAYLSTLNAVEGVRITAVADLDEQRARDTAESLPHARAMSTAELVASDDVDLVLNLTIPIAHAEVALAAIAQGKDVYGEKPLTADLASARGVVAAAAEAGVALGCAPDTVLGIGTQTARSAIERGLIGRPTSATATMITAGHERWHANPDFYYKPGGGPLLDMGPYYVTSLVHLLGPIRSVIGAASRPRPTRTVATGPRAGATIDVEVDTHVTGILEHENGALSTLTTSFEGTRTTAAPIEVHGEIGSLSVPDPNRFDGDVSVIGVGDADWRVLDPDAGYDLAARGVGLIDLVTATSDRAPRADGALALHVLEAMDALLRSAQLGARVTLESTVQPPPLVPYTTAEGWGYRPVD